MSRRRPERTTAGELEVSIVGGATYRFTDAAEAARTYKRLRRQGIAVQLCWRTRPPATDATPADRPEAA